MKKSADTVKLKKKSVLSGIIIAFAALNILTMAFTVIKGGINHLLESEFYFANGFTLAFSGYPVIVDEVGVWLSIYSAVHFAIALALILALSVFALAKRSFDFGRFGTFSVISSVLLSILYAVHGIIAYSAASDYAGGSQYYSCSTAAFVPFIISLILAVAFFLVKYKAPEEIEFSL